MADFFKGLAGGLQTGAQFGQLLREGEERKRLREAMGLTPQAMEQRQATPEELGRAQAETQGLVAEDARMFDLTPQEQAMYAPQMPVEGQRIGATQYGLGGQTFSRMPTQQEIESARYGAAANVIAERDPVAAMRMRREMEEQAYQAKRRPLELAGLERSAKLGDIQLTEAERGAAASKRQDDFAAFAAENPNATTAELKDAAFKQFKFSPEQWQKTVTTRLGIENAEMDSFKNSVKKKLQGRNLSQVGEIYNTDPAFDDKTDLAIVPGKNGAVTLNFIDKGSKTVTESQTFKNQALALEYLNKQATEPETIGSWMMNLRKTEAAIEESTAGTKLKTAQAGAVGLEKLSPLEKNLATLQRLKIPVTDAQIKTLVLGAQKDPALEAELAAITKIAGSDTANPKVLEALPGQIQAALARSKGRETAAAVVSGLTQAQEAGKGEEAVAALRKRGMPESALQAAAASAGVAYIPPAQPATAAAPSVGLRTTPPTAYVPPAGSRAAIAQEARAQATATQAESVRLATQAQQKLATEFAADTRTLSPVELVRKYDRVRGQLPREQAVELQTIQRNIR